MIMKACREYPKGAITHVEDIIALIIDGGKLYRVGQSGDMDTHEVNVYNAYIGKSAATGIEALYINGFYDTCMIDANIPPNRYNDHFFFTNKRLAEEFASFVANDPTHMAAVKAHHEWCNKIFRDLWDLD
jgi:hypothetical protein